MNDSLYMLNEYVRRIKNGSSNVYQFFSVGVLALVFIAVYILVKGQYLAGGLLLAFCFISFFVLFSAQQVTKDIMEVEKIVKRLKQGRHPGNKSHLSYQQ